MVLLVALVVGAGVVLLGGGDGDDDDGRSAAPAVDPTPLQVPSEDVEGDATPITLDRRDIVVTYRVEGFTAEGGAVVDTERHWVRVPFESRVETVPGDGSDEDSDVEPTFLQIGGFGYLQTGRDAQAPAVLAVEPSIGAGDVFVDTSGLEFQQQRRTVLGETCQVFRNGGPVDVTIVSEPSTQYADICVADDGLLLHEEWVIDNEVFRRRIAVDVDDDAEIDDSRFEPTGPMPNDPQSGVLTEVTADSQPPGVTFHWLPAPPEGFELRGRYGYTPPRAPLDVTQAEPPKVALVLDVYTDGDGGLLVVANGTTSDNRPIIEVGADDETVDLGPTIGTAAVLRGLHQHELRVPFDRGRFLRVWGTRPVEDLAVLARTLQPVTDPNATVTPVDEP